MTFPDKSVSNSGCRRRLHLCGIDAMNLKYAVFPFLLIFPHLHALLHSGKIPGYFQTFQSPLLHPFFSFALDRKKSFQNKLKNQGFSRYCAISWPISDVAFFLSPHFLHSHVDTFSYRDICMQCPSSYFHFLIYRRHIFVDLWDSSGMLTTISINHFPNPFFITRFRWLWDVYQETCPFPSPDSLASCWHSLYSVQHTFFLHSLFTGYHLRAATHAISVPITVGNSGVISWCNLSILEIKDKN